MIAGQLFLVINLIVASDEDLGCGFQEQRESSGDLWVKATSSSVRAATPLPQLLDCVLALWIRASTSLILIHLAPLKSVAWRTRLKFQSLQHLSAAILVLDRRGPTTSCEGTGVGLGKGRSEKRRFNVLGLFDILSPLCQAWN